MQAERLRPVVVTPQWSGERCLRCDARRHSVCNVIDDADLGTLASAAVEQRVERGAFFTHEGDPASDFFNITAGTAKIFKLLPDGRQQIIGFARAGHFLGLAVSETYAFSAQAIEPISLCRFSRPKLARLLDDFPKFERRLLETACNELASAQEQMLLLGRKTARERVASFLLAVLHDAPCGTENNVRLPMTRSEIADYLGLTIETVSRTLSRFKAERRISIPSHDRVVLLDRPWMQDIAAGSA